ncbi:hypothetical protein H0H81_009332 [Sphagnurus paluster]|uniref:Uncharacterized protein n=1 Tax=Sphagnurus paluster TaxID=117069 RepID=A0A9P7FPG6_9AGAR|nr:hypothetical protein H0H81_009332 [Sphagnurus paluster]
MTFTFHFMPEIEDEIFEHAAFMYPTYAPALSVVSRRVQTRVEYIIYETIELRSMVLSFLEGMSFIERFEPTLNARPAEFFAKRVRNLFIEQSVPPRFIPLILSKCTGIQNLSLSQAMWQHRIDHTETPKLILPLASTLRSLEIDRLTLSQLAALGTVFPCFHLLSILAWPGPTHVPIANLDWLPGLAMVVVHLGRQPCETDTRTAKDLSTLLSAQSLRTVELRYGTLRIQGHVRRWEGGQSKIAASDVDLYSSGNRVKDWENFCGIYGPSDVKPHEKASLVSQIFG